MYLLDTNIVSELRKIRSGKADANVARWSASVDASDLFISVITIQELQIGVLLAELRDPVQGAALRKWLNSFVLPSFDGRILSIDMACALRSGKLHVPDPKPFRDSLIAATALVHKMTMVTRNVHDFESTGTPIIDPWNYQ